MNFLSAVGKDPSSQMIRNSLAGAALYLTETADHATCSCSVVFDQSGDCKLIIASDMDIFNTVTPEFVCPDNNCYADNVFPALMPN